jgi:hypothetical protein
LDAGNWDIAPAEGNNLAFPSVASNLTNNNDLTSTSGFGSLTLSGGGYTITGNVISLSGSVDSSQSSGTNTVNLPISFGSNTATVTVDNGGALLDLGGLITGSGGLTKEGSGQLDLTADNTFTGTTTINAGILAVDGNQQNSPVTINSGATLGGSGTVNTITSNSGTVSPGTSSPAILTDTGDLNLGAGSTFTAALNGDTAGSGYSQLVVAGQVNLNNATLNATAGFTPTGNDQFTIINNLGSGAVNGTFDGLAEGATTTINGETYRISYVGGTGNDVVLTHLLGSTTTVSASSTSLSYGQTVTLTADVASATSGSSNSPTGNVQFYNGSTLLGTAAVSNGVATLTSVGLTAGTASITAKYVGDTNFNASTSSAVTVAVAQASSTTALTTSPNPSANDATVTLTATVAAVSPATTTPTGTVEFFNGSTSLGTATLSGGVATLNTTALTTVGADSLTAQYQGDTNYLGSTSTAVTQTVLQGTTTTVASAPNPTVFGETVALTANVSANTAGVATPTGTVQFFSGSTSLGIVVLSSGVATLDTTALATGSDSITAQYAGNSTYAASTSAAITHTTNQASTTTALTASPSPSVLGQSVTLTATITPVSPGSGTPTGTVQFFNGTTSLGTATLSGGVATLATTALTVGTDSLTAQYQGDTNFTGSTSTAVTQTVTQSGAAVTLTVTKTNPVAFEAVQFTATVASASSSTNTPTGTVLFFSDGTLIGSGILSSGSATLTTTGLPVGDQSITAVYQGDTNFAGTASSAPLSMTVGDQNQLFVNQVFLDLFGLPADPTGLQYWTSRLEQGITRKQVVRTIVESPEARLQAVAGTYLNLVGTSPSTKQIAAIAGASQSSTHVTLEAKILGSKDYFQTQGGGTVDGFIDALYRDVLDTSPTAAETARIKSALAQGFSRVTIAQDLLQSTQGRSLRVTGLYQAILGRSPDAKGLRFYVGLLGQGFGNNRVIIDLFASEEFYTSFHGIP